MSLFHSQTIFNILITLIICSVMFIFFRFKLRILEISQREQAKVLQSLVMSMRNGGHQRNMVSDDEIMKHVQMQMQKGGAGEGAGVPGSQSHHSNDLIDVSDDDDDEDDDDESESSSDSEDDDTDSSSSEDEKEENDENHENTTKKIIFNNGGALDTHAHPIEHLTGDDIKVIELTEPLYAVGGGNVSGSGPGSKHDTNDVSDDDDDDNDDDDNEDMSDDDNDNDNDDEETSDDTEVKVQELPSHEHEHEQHLETSVIDTIEIKTIFKADKQQQQQPQQQQQHTDYNSMNVQALKQHLKTKLSADGLQYNETAINKLNKKELIKHLTQG
jgi:hypothetical protein